MIGQSPGNFMVVVIVKVVVVCIRECCCGGMWDAGPGVGSMEYVGMVMGGCGVGYLEC